MASDTFPGPHYKPPSKQPFYFPDGQVVFQASSQAHLPSIIPQGLTRRCHSTSRLERGYTKSTFTSSNGNPNSFGTCSLYRRETQQQKPQRGRMTTIPSKSWGRRLRNSTLSYASSTLDYKPTIDDWLSILSISTRFIFDKVREKAIAEITARLNDLDPFELIAGAEKHNIDQWLMPAYRRIVLRSALVSEREALNIPLSTSIMLMRSRERFWKQYYHYQYSDTYDGTISHPEVDPIIDEQIRAMRSSKIQ
ncbi:hypothetical protein BC834DRAFT_871626 [Gloeopeniophorella convolvens]|nr:hypothetical protein BC834DRAFT_871626 [Gloeopeniophorella convolvens]